MHQQKHGIRQRHHLMGILMGIVILWHWGTGESAACILTSISCNSPCTATADGCLCPADTDVSLTAHLSVACGINDTIWRVTDLSTGQVNEYSYNLWQPGFTHTFSEAGAYTVKVIVYPTDHPASAKLITVTAPETSFTVNVLPTTGCTVMAGDGGVDAVEAPNGIVCSGTTAADDPLCTEQYQNSQIASLKVIPAEGYAFTGWTVNGAQVQTAAAPLFLTTMPVLAQTGEWITPFTGNRADCQANCSHVTMTAPDTVQRDEIFEVTLTLDPPPLWTGTTVTFDLIGQKTHDLPGRGTVQMYDFGYDRDGDGTVEPGQTAYTFVPLLDGGTKTIKAVYNLSETPPYVQPAIKIAAKFGKYTFESSPIAVMYQVRQYTTEHNNATVNDYDELITQWVDYWIHWHYPDEQNPYTFKMAAGDVEDKLTYDLVKAICYKESTMKDVDVMQLTGEAKQGLQNDRDWNWSVPPDSSDPEKGDLYPMSAHPKMGYSGIDDTSASNSLKWGIRWLYAKKSEGDYDSATNRAYNPQWFDWATTLAVYNSDADPNNSTYVNDVMNLNNSGKNPHDGLPLYLWPIMTNGFPRD